MMNWDENLEKNINLKRELNNLFYKIKNHENQISTEGMIQNGNLVHN